MTTGWDSAVAEIENLAVGTWDGFLAIGDAVYDTVVGVVTLPATIVHATNSSIGGVGTFGALLPWLIVLVVAALLFFIFKNPGLLKGLL